MKKIFLLIFTLVISLGLTACDLKDIGSKENKKDSENTGGSGSVSVKVNTSEKKEDVFNDETVIKNLTTDATYTWKEGSYYYAALIVKNNSSMDCELKANVVFKDSEGNTIGADEDIIYAFEKNTEACLIVENDTEFATFDYTYEAEKADFYSPASSSISCEASTTDKKAILTFKNNGEDTADSLEYVALFMLGEEVVDYRNGFISDLGAGSTKVEEANYYNSKKGFDNVKIYYSAYKTDF